MKLEKYRKANCELFWLPPLDLSKVDKMLEVALVEAFEKGGSVNEVLDSILDNGQIISSLEEQVAENLEFQKTSAIDKVEDDKQDAIALYSEKKEELLDELQETVVAEAQEKERELGEAYQQFDTRTKKYSARKARLEEMRSRIRKKIGEVGGREGFETLQRIDQMVTSGGDYQTAKRSYEDAQSVQGYTNEPAVSGIRVEGSSLEQALDLALTEEEIDPLKEKAAKVELVEEDGERKKGRVYHFFQRGTIRQKIYKILTYEVW